VFAAKSEQKGAEKVRVENEEEEFISESQSNFIPKQI
jgi:hypothetical protein